MLALIAESPIVSTDTLRADDLCSALIAEADRLGIVLDRDLWQPAAAIAAHGQYGGLCLDLPPRLAEISLEIVADLFEALNWEAPSGCSLGACEGDGACFLWTLTIGAQTEAMNSDPASKFEAITLTVPDHWLSALINGDCSGFDDQEESQFNAFCDGELSGGWHISAWEEEGSFMKYHDAQPYGVLACNAVEVLAMRAKGEG